MSSADAGDLPVVNEPAIPCRHLRNKGMYVYTDGQGGESHEGYDNSIYWCLKTMTGYGPDDDLCGGRDCRVSARSCYEPL